MSKALHLEMPPMSGLDDRVRDVLNEKLLRIADALKSAGPSADVVTLQGPHSGRLAIDPNTEPVGRAFLETDRSALYIVRTLAAIRVWAFETGLYADTLAKRPTDLRTHDQGFRFLATDTGEPFVWSGSAWVQQKHASTHQHGGSDEVATVTPSANAIPKAKATNKLDVGWIPDLSSTYMAVGAAAGGDLTGTYPNPTLKATGTAGTYTKVTTDAQGRVSSGTTLAVGDLPTAAQPLTTQSVNLGSGGANTRALNTVYQNTTGKQIWVSVNVGIPSGSTSLNGLTDASNPPTTAVVQQGNYGTGTNSIHVLFPVLNGNYYKVNAPGGSGTPVWYEWS